MRPVILACAALVVASAAAAQSLPRAAILSDFERGKANVLAYVNAAPDSMMGFRPTPGVRTFAQQIEHVVESNAEVAAIAVGGLKNAPALGDSTRYLHNKAALLAYATAAYDYALAAIRSATPAQLERRSKMYDQPEEPAWRWLQLTHEHSVWTLGQVVPYLRLNGATPPAYNLPF